MLWADSDDVITLPAGGLLVQEALCGVWLFEVLVLGGVWVGVFLLVEVAKGVVHLAVLALIGTDWVLISLHVLSRELSVGYSL